MSTLRVCVASAVARAVTTSAISIPTRRGDIGAAFRRLARSVPVEVLRVETATGAMALLTGVSGLLPPDVPARWDGATRRYVRGLWDRWWKKQPEFAGLVMPKDAWSLAGLRPQNHPVRRMAAAAALFRGAHALGETLAAVDGADPARWTAKTMALFTGATGDSYWRRRLGLSCAPGRSDIALLGEDRAAAILCNVVVPFLVATDRVQRGAGELLGFLPPAHDDALARCTAFALFGRDYNPKFHRTALRQQGLLQIFNDFCLGDRSACKSCGLPAVVAEMARA